MYNRYIPQGDGSWRRSPVADRPEHRSNPQERPPEPMPEPPPEPHRDCRNCPSRPRPRPEPAGNFLKELLPPGLDTEDLLVVVLLLLMSGRCREERNLPLLTLALYLFL